MTQFVDLMQRIDDRLASIDRKLEEHGERLACLEGKMTVTRWAILAVPSVVGAILGAAATAVALLV